MEMVVVVRPTIEEYRARVIAMAKKYGCETWIGLSVDEMSREDRFEYSFIISAVGDQLIHREFLDMSQTPGYLDRSYQFSTEPGLVPGSVFWSGGTIERGAVCGAH